MTAIADPPVMPDYRLMRFTCCSADSEWVAGLDKALADVGVLARTLAALDEHSPQLRGLVLADGARESEWAGASLGELEPVVPWRLASLQAAGLWLLSERLHSNGPILPTWFAESGANVVFPAVAAEVFFEEAKANRLIERASHVEGVFGEEPRSSGVELELWWLTPQSRKLYVALLEGDPAKIPGFLRPVVELTDEVVQERKQKYHRIVINGAPYQIPPSQFQALKGEGNPPGKTRLKQRLEKLGFSLEHLHIRK